ncbi:thiamine-monophosphate kinase [Candidatus Endolissoclinum faulkneri L5]|uniref:Thiamine-monophosphate kinase n=1 Tax=Candidatus Endolissoclinum faulkneri L5 TaxID=1401328 RepID=V9TVJ5_9PROT|nr:thiamine-phosphate kinase [Candidatus Endolissoclinum faulkneri]AHC73703.1 thiamine-monophosphate kinase [Candidatus Endolissoclinum faulkneri L5]
MNTLSKKNDLIDEFDIIAKFFTPLAKDAPGTFGLLEDAAILPTIDSHQEWVVTVESIVCNVHFLPNDPFELIARKALRVTLSDLAAMGAKPYGYTLTIALNRDLSDSCYLLEKVSHGLTIDQAEFGIHLIGGDSVSTDGPITLAITAFGITNKAKALRRSAAMPGQDLWISGTIGDGALGLQVAKGILSKQYSDLAGRYRLPQPRISLGCRLSEIAAAAIDVSDGLILDASHIANQSKCRLVIDGGALPISESVSRIIADHSEMFELILTGGDDYELLFTAEPEAIQKIKQAGYELDIPITRIGRVDSGEGVDVLDHNGIKLNLLIEPGWTHF